MLFVGQDMVNHKGSNKISGFLLGDGVYASIVLLPALLQEILLLFVKLSLMVNILTEEALLIF